MDREKWQKLKNNYSAFILERVGNEYIFTFTDAEEIKKYWPHDCPITLSNVEQVITAIVKAGYRVAGICTGEGERRAESHYRTGETPENKESSTINPSEPGRSKKLPGRTWATKNDV